MTQSEWKCPECKHNLFVTKSARYLCSTCQAEKEPARVDPLGRDWVMAETIIEIAGERARLW
jgi:uncharacterized Zn finger protein (UPF0148 family)